MKLFRKILLLLLFAVVINFGINSKVTGTDNGSEFAGEESEEETLVTYQVDKDYPPYTFESGNRIYGFDVDLGNLIFNSKEYQLDLSTGDWTDIYSKVKTGEIDVAGIIAVTEERKEEVLFSDTVLVSYVAIYTKSDFRKIEVSDLKKLKIGVGKGYYTESLLKSDIQNSSYITYENIREAVKDLKSGKIDAIFENQQYMDYVLIEMGENNQISKQISNLYPRDHAYAVAKGREDLVIYINQRISVLKSSGVFEELYVKYFYNHSEGYFIHKWVRIVAVMGIVLMTCILVMLFMRQYISNLKSKLENNVKELEGKNILLQDAHNQIEEQYNNTFQLAYYDALTNIPNKILLNKKMEDILKSCKSDFEKISICFLDFDNFKIINDTLGHDTGDEVLKAIASELGLFVEEPSFVSRMAGDVFVAVVCDDTKLTNTNTFVDQVMSNYRKNLEIGEEEVYVSMSMGIAVWPDDSRDQGRLLSYADTALHCVKANGKGNFQFFQKSMLEEIKLKTNMEKTLRKALEKKEFQLHYQPYYDVNTRKMVGMEALIRWYPPGKSPIPPLEFIPLAEETGLIVEIGKWVIEEAVSQYKKWEEKGFEEVRLAINISTIQLKNKNFLEELKEILQKYNFNPRNLEIEITESSFMEALEVNLITLNKIKAFGIQISLDDFGTGYSSLSHIQNYPLDTVKIDKSFVDKIHKKGDTGLIIGDIISIVHKLDMDVIAEGIEEEEQFEFLKMNHCDKVQGYLLSKPVKPEGIEKILEELKYDK